MKILAHGLILGFAAIAAIAPSAEPALAIFGEPSYRDRVAIIHGSMLNGGCGYPSAEKANEVLDILDGARAQGLVLYSGRQFIQAASNAIRQSQLPQLYLVACNWEAGSGMISVPYRFTLLGVVNTGFQTPGNTVSEHTVYVYRLDKR